MAPPKGHSQSPRWTGAGGTLDSIQKSDSDSSEELLKMMMRQKLIPGTHTSSWANKSKNHPKNSKYTALLSAQQRHNGRGINKNKSGPGNKFSITESQGFSSDLDDEERKSVAKGSVRRGNSKPNSSRVNSGKNYPHLPRINENPKYSNKYAGAGADCVSTGAKPGQGRLLGMSISKTNSVTQTHYYAPSPSGGFENRSGAKSISRGGPKDARDNLKSITSNRNIAKNLNEAKLKSLTRVNSGSRGGGKVSSYSNIAPNYGKSSLNRARNGTNGSKRETLVSEKRSGRFSGRPSDWSGRSVSQFRKSIPPLHQQREQLQDKITARTEDLFPWDWDPSLSQEQDGNQNISCLNNNTKPMSYKLATDPGNAEEIGSLQYKTFNGQTNEDCPCGCGAQFVCQGQGQGQGQNRLSEDKAQQFSGTPQPQLPQLGASVQCQGQGQGHPSRFYVDHGQQQSLVAFQNRPSCRSQDKSEQFSGPWRPRSMDQGQQFRGVNDERDSGATLYTGYGYRSQSNFSKPSDPNGNFFSGRKTAHFAPTKGESKELISADAVLRSAKQILIDAAKTMRLKRPILGQAKCHKNPVSTCVAATERDRTSCPAPGGSMCRPPRKCHKKNKKSSVFCECCANFDFDGFSKQQQLMQMHAQLQALGQAQGCQSVNFPNNPNNGMLLLPLPLIPQQNGQMGFNPMLLQQDLLNKGFRNSSQFQQQILPMGQMLPPQQRLQSRDSRPQTEIVPPAAAGRPRLVSQHRYRYPSQTEIGIRRTSSKESFGDEIKICHK